MTYFPLCIHNHQPVGNFEKVLEESYQDSYWPFLKALAEHPSVKLSLHNTGFLVDWMAEKHPEYVELLRSMVSAGQVEVLGGGYYEPIIQVIPAVDRAGQINRMADRVEKLFGKRPRGMWLAERVWEPELPTHIKSTGMEYLLVDDYHFIKSGLTREELGGYYITEDQGNLIKLFPGSEALRYLIPFKAPEELKDHLIGLKDFLRRGNAAIYGDDGEKFGVWPGTKKWVFEDGWLEDFFTMVEGCLDEGWLKSVTLSEYMDSNEPVGRVYLPTASYMEMGEWTLPAEASRDFAELVEDLKHREDGEKIRRFVQGGFWRNFFSKYPESNWMHKRMLMVSSELESGKGRPGYDEAIEHLYRAQCNDPYWHGVFGGLYMPHLRTSVYENLLKAEVALAIGPGPGNRWDAAVKDIDADGHNEVVVRTSDMNLFLSPRRGGAIEELDYTPRAVNLSNTLARWHEGYHHRLEEEQTVTDISEAKSIHDVVLVKEEGLEKYLKYDPVRRTSFRERFLGAGETLDAFYSNTHTEYGDFFDNGYSPEVTSTGVTLKRDGLVGGAPVTVIKDIRPFGDDSFDVRYLLRGEEGDGAKGVLLGVELNLLLPCCDGPVCRYRTAPMKLGGEACGLGSTGELMGLTEISLDDTLTGVTASIKVDKPARLWRFPVHTVSLSEAGFEKIYQGSCLLFLFPFEGPKGLDVKFTVRLAGL